METATTSFFCIHFVHAPLCAYLDELSLHALHAAAWRVHNSVPDDTPPASPPLTPQPQWGSTYLLTPAAAEAMWPCLTTGERASLQAAEWWVHADLRWYIRGMAALPDLLHHSSSSSSKNKALCARRPRRSPPSVPDGLTRPRALLPTMALDNASRIRERKRR